MLFFVSLRIFDARFTEQIINSSTQALSVCQISKPSSMDCISPCACANMLRKTIKYAPKPAAQPHINMERNLRIYDFAIKE